MNGFILLNKKIGISSAKALYQIKDVIPKNTKVGHAGTLDPFASGLLIVGVGKATKAIEYVMGMNKTYEFIVKWGEATNTDDLTGQIINISHNIPSIEEIQRILPSFNGVIKQKPPNYSAINIQGKRAYDLARQGVKFNLTARNVEITSLLITSHDGCYTNFIMECGKGCYVRSIAKDLAEKLDTYGHVTALRRTKIGKFSIDQASMKIIPISDMLDFQVIEVTDITAQQIINGCLLKLEMQGRFFLKNDNYNLLCIYDASEGQQKLKRI